MPQELSRRQALKGIAATGTLGSTAGCVGTLTGGGSKKVAVGSKQFTEQELLGFMSVEALKENADVKSKNEVSLGGTKTNFEALTSGQIDTYWEYTGTAWATLPPKHDTVITEPEKLYKKIDEEFGAKHDLGVLNRAQFNNTYVLTANPDWVQQTGVKTISDFAEYVNGGNTDFTVALNAEFQSRADGWPGLAKHYGFDDAREKLNVKNINSGLLYQVVGSGEAQIGVGFNTNPKILKFDLEVLDDDEQFFPVYNPAPLVRQDTLDAAPSIKDPLNAIGPELDTETIRGLNRKVSIGGKDTQEVARQFLSDAGVI